MYLIRKQQFSECRQLGLGQTILQVWPVASPVVNHFQCPLVDSLWAESPQSLMEAMGSLFPANHGLSQLRCPYFYGLVIPILRTHGATKRACLCGKPTMACLKVHLNAVHISQRRTMTYPYVVWLWKVKSSI